MSAQEIANENSSLLSFLGASAPKTSPFTYALRKNAPKFSKQNRVAVSGPTTPVVNSGQEIRYTVPRYGVLTKISLDCAVTLVTSLTTGDWGPIGAYARFDLKARDKTIATLYPQNIIDWIKSQPKHVIDYYRNDYGYSDGAHAATRHFSIPLPFSFTDRVSNNINTRFAEPLELVVTMSALSTDFATTLVTVKTDVDFYYLSPGAEELANMKQSMLKAGRAGIPRLQWSVYKEAVATTTTDADVTIDIKCPYPVFKTLIYITDDVQFSANGVKINTVKSGPAQATEELRTLVLSASGSDIYNLTNIQLREMMAHDGYDANPLASGLADNNDSRNGMYVLKYGLGNDGVDQTGIISFKNLANPQLVINCKEAANSIHVFHYYYQIESTSPDDGQISIRALT
jgi:hypothetical protein